MFCIVVYSLILFTMNLYNTLRLFESNIVQMLYIELSVSNYFYKFTETFIVWSGLFVGMKDQDYYRATALDAICVG